MGEQLESVRHSGAVQMFVGRGKELHAGADTCPLPFELALSFFLSSFHPRFTAIHKDQNKSAPFTRESLSYIILRFAAL